MAETKAETVKLKTELKTVKFKIKRQDNPKATPRWEEFELTWKPGMNVISAMMEIAANPVTKDGKPTTAITYDSNCLEEVCGSCAMLINGKARMACSALVDKLEQPITIEPFSASSLWCAISRSTAACCLRT